MKNDYLVVFLAGSNKFVDERIYQAESIQEVEEWAERYINMHEPLWCSSFQERPFYFKIMKE